MAAKNPYLKRKALPAAKFSVARAGVIKQEPAVMVIQGIPADSKEEWYVAQALDKLELEYEYQKTVGGGRLRRGGQVLDFLVYTPGKWTVVDVKGAYWHTGKHEDELSLQLAMHGRGWNLVVVWDYEIKDVQQAVEVLSARLPHG